MRSVAAVLIGVLLLWCAAADAREQSAAIFDFELTDTSRENQLAPQMRNIRRGLQPDERSDIHGRC